MCPWLAATCGCGGLQRAPRAVEVDVDDAVPVSGARDVDRLQRAEDSGAGDDDVDRAEVLGHLTHHLLKAFEVANVDRPPAREPIAAEAVGLLAHCIGVEVEQRDVRAVSAQRAGQTGPEATAGAGDRRRCVPEGQAS